MDDRRVGSIIRALRRRRGWRQADLAGKAGCSQAFVSLIERGHLDAAPLKRLRAVLAALDADAIVEVRWRGGALDRLLDERHADLVGRVVAVLEEHAWLVRVEVSYAHYGERGSIDVLAWHQATRSILVVEVKSELASVEQTVRKIDEKERLAMLIARERFGWEATSASRLLVLPDASVERRRVARARAVLAAGFPDRGVHVRRWLREPEGRLAGIRFVAFSSTRSGRRSPGGVDRVRVRAPAATATTTGP